MKSGKRLSLTLTAGAGLLFVIMAWSLSPSTAAKDNFELREAVAFSSLRDGSLEVYLMDPDGTNQRRLTAVDDDGEGFANLSPDGKKIVFDSNRNRPAPGTLVDENGDPCVDVPGGTEAPSLFVSDLFLMNIVGREQTHLIRGSSATWSPDGKSIAFHSSASGADCPSRLDPGAAATDSDIFVANVDDLLAGAEQPTNITNSENLVDDDADWSSTGRIVYTAHNDGDDIGAGAGAASPSSRMYVINPDGTGRARVTDGSVEERSPAWSPDGNSIVYMCKIGGPDFEVCVVSANEGGTWTTPTVLTENTVFDGGPNFSPDGQQLVVQQQIPGQGMQVVTLAPRLNPDGEPPTATQLTNTEPTEDPQGRNLFPQWGVQRVKTTSP